MLHDLDLAELIAEDLEGYEQLAVALARDPLRLKQIRQKLAHNRRTTALFDTVQLCRDLEAAYARMTEIRLSGQRPRNFDVDAKHKFSSG
jgi:protein O-GlcNAc transferase